MTDSPSSTTRGLRRRRALGLVAALASVAATGTAVALFGAVSPATGAATASPPQNASPPAITGTAAEGQTLSASSGTWTGATPISYAYQWLRCDTSGGTCQSISGATSLTYTLVAADGGATIRVSVTATNTDGSATAPSAATATVTTAGTAPSPATQPTPTGTAQVGQTLTMPTGTWNGTGPFTYTYQWQRCTPNGPCQSISGATAQTYAVTAADVGFQLRAYVYAHNGAGTGQVNSNLTAVVVQAGAAPANVALPVVSGTARSGQTLSVASGTWSGTAPLSFAYQWLRCDGSGASCTSISGATGLTYAVTSADVGSTIRAAVTATNSGGSTTAQSAQTAVVATPSAPAGTAVSVTALALPDRLVVDRVSFSPLRSRQDIVTARFHVSDLEGHPVTGALVYVLALPYGWMTQPGEQATGSDGWATLQMRPTAQTPIRRGAAVVMFVRARKPGENLLAGVSTRRLVQLLVS
jgi:hypothetical protein